jgi:hypothetical protein
MRLLRLIDRASGSIALPELARQLGVSEALLEPMIQDLVRRGYLAPVEAGCERGACRLCPQRGGCSLPPAARLWALTKRGRQLTGGPARAQA